MSATAARRSTSLTRSSPTSVKTVVPSATAAATARTGTSSSEGISAAATSVARSGPGRACRLATWGPVGLDGHVRPHARQHADEAERGPGPS